jgi:D-beta-D-heptose 7-phosphate kinase/D-beta-D-heptose 1-phosphate adenosyltransferase
MTMLAALRSVDWVVPFSEDTPERLIRAIKPNFLVKGGDYEIAAIAGSQFVLENGGQVKIIPFREGFSTSLLIDKVLLKSPN